ncbi:MAG: response regulator [Cyanobacteria bacterium Co-bin13]|nr:response regulator [Cyanobacteria bacterium Co-bin13]
MNRLRFLLLEDSSIDADLIQVVLREGGLDYELIQVQTQPDFLNALDHQAFDLILADYCLPTFDGVSALEIARVRCPDVPFIFVSGTLGEEVAVEMLKGGATDYVLKQRLNRLVPSVQRALQERRERVARQQAEKQLQHYTHRLQMLSEAAHSFAQSIPNFQGLLDTVCSKIGELAGDLCLLQLISEDEQWLQIVAVYHPQPNEAARLRQLTSEAPQRVTEGMAGQVLQSRQPLVLPLTSVEALRSAIKAEYVPYLESVPIFGLLMVPLQVRDRSLGCLILAREMAEQPFMPDDQAFLQDLADRAALAIDNALLYQKSQETNRIKDEFLAMLSHELRSPLNAILGWLSLLRNRQFDEATVAKALETVERNAKTQARLVEDLLDVSRILQGKLRLNLRALELLPLIEASVETVRPDAEAKNVLLQIAPPAIAGLVSGDGERLQQVIWNLLSNAIKFTPSGGQVTVGLEVVEAVDLKPSFSAQKPSCLPSVDGPKQYAQITVTDTGQGIQREFLPHIFERFRQADSSITRSHGGLGLGLAIVQHLVNLHGGTVFAQSDGVGLGSTFTVKLPLMMVDAATNLARVLAEDDSKVGNPSLEQLSGLNVLVVDADLETRLLLVSVLEEYGAEVTAAASAQQGLVSLTGSARHFDVLISDIGMPEEDGYALLRQVRSLKSDQGGQIPAIALTAHGNEDSHRKALSASFQAHLAKPINPTELIELVANLQGKLTQSGSQAGA